MTPFVDVSDAALVEVVAAWQRVASWATVQSARAAAALAERDSMNPDWPETVQIAQPCIAGDELAMRLGWSRRMATRLVADGRAYEQAMAWTGDALADGAICPVKARILIDSLGEQPLEVALAVQDAVLGDAPGLTPTKLTRRIAREILQIDPVAARAAHERARSRRRLERPKPLPNGMAGIRAVLDATDAIRLDNGIDALARAVKDAGDARSLEQLRADLFVDLTLGRLCPGPADRQDVGTTRSGTMAEAADDGTFAGAADDGTLAGASGDCALADATEDGAMTGTIGGGSERSRLTAGSQADAPDHGRADDPSADRLAGQPATATVTATAARQTCPPLNPDLPLRAVIQVTVPLSTLLGTSDEPGDLAGYGPIHPDTARALALEGPWQRIVTDPLSGNVLDVGRTRYRPPAALADHVMARDRTCTSPSCSTDARACDLDHTVPFGDGGRTADDNIGPACRRDHLIKTHGGVHVEQPEPGRFIYVTPTGHRYDVTPGSDQPRRHVPPSGPRPDSHRASSHGVRPHDPGDDPPTHGGSADCWGDPPPF